MHGNAGLAGITEASGDAAVGGVGEVGVAVDDYASVSAQLEDHFLLAGIFLDLPSHGGAAGEADELDALVGDQQGGVFIGEWEDVEGAVGPSGLLHALG